MMPNCREIALRVLCRVEGEGSYIALALDAELQKTPSLDRRDKGLATELIYGAVRHRNTLDWYLDQLAKKPMQKTNLCLRNLLRLGAYQLLMLDRIPPSAAINESVKLAGQYSRKMKLPAKTAKGVVNGILRQLHRSRATLKTPTNLSPLHVRLSAECSFPEWLVRRWEERLGPEKAEEACRINNQPSPLCLRVNSLKLSVKELSERLHQQIESLQPLPSPLPGLRISGTLSLSEIACLSNGEATVQNPSSMLIPIILDPQPGEQILDVCAGSGTKTTQIAELMHNHGRITAVDIYENKLRRLHQQCESWGVKIVQSLCLDMSTVNQLSEKTSENVRGFDRILVDAPCSGLGVLRKHPEAKWTRKERDIRELQELQYKILTNAAGLLSPTGGILVYSTCTTAPEENEELLARFLRKMPNFRIDPILEHIPDELQVCLTPEGYLRIDPPRRLYDGFFCARLSST